MTGSDLPPAPVAEYARGRRLRPGRHGLSPQQVAAAQRERLIVAALYAIAERGYAQTTVADIVARAAVSRTTFYQQFSDREHCFLASYDYALAHVEAELADAAASLADDAPWQARLEVDIDTYLDVLASEPALALILHQEVMGVGPAAMDRRAQLLALLAGRVVALGELARRQNPALPETPPELFALYTGGLDELIRDRLRIGGPPALRELSAPLRRATTALLGAR